MDDRQLVCYLRNGTCSLRVSVCCVLFIFFFILRPSPLIFMFLIDMVCQSRVGRSAKQKGQKENFGHNVQRHEIKAY